MWTVPTGFSGVPPPGPAMPVTLTAKSAPEASRAPWAISRAVSPETAPMLGKRLLHDAEVAPLGLVGVGDEAFPKDFGRVRHGGEALGDEAAGAGLGGRERLAEQGKQMDQGIFQRLVVHAVNPVAQPFPQLLFDGGNESVGFLVGARRGR